jgi:hypothetical protein
MITASTLTTALADASTKELRRQATQQRALDGMQHELDQLAARHAHGTRFARLAALASVLGL